MVDKEDDPLAIKYPCPARPRKKNCIHLHLASEMSFPIFVPSIKQRCRHHSAEGSNLHTPKGSRAKHDTSNTCRDI